MASNPNKLTPKVVAIAVAIFAFGFLVVGPLMNRAHADTGRPVTSFNLSPGWVKVNRHCVTNYAVVRCSRGWRRVNASEDDWLSEAYNGPRLHEDFTRCIIRYADTTRILCPDGREFTS